MKTTADIRDDFSRLRCVQRGTRAGPARGLVSAIAVLAFALGVALYETSYFSSVFMVLSLTNLAALGRKGFGINKYVLWVGMAGIVHVARPHFGDDSPYLWPLAFAVSTAATLVNAVRYVQRKNAAAKEPAKKAD